MKYIFATLVFVSFLCNGQKISVVTEHVPPMQKLNEDGSLTGVSIDLLEAMLSEANLTPSYRVLPWPRALAHAESHKNTLILSMIRNPEREQRFIWLAKLVEFTPNAIALKARTDISIKNIEELQRYKIGVARADFGESYLKSIGFVEGKNLHVTSKYDHVWKMLYTGRVDLGFANNLTNKEGLISAGLSPELIEGKYNFSSISKELYLAANLDTDPQIIQQIQHAFQKIVENGTYDKIREDWGVVGL